MEHLNILNSNTIIEDLFIQREKVISAKITNQEEYNKLLQEKSIKYKAIEIAMNNIPDGFVETKKNIQTSMKQYFEILLALHRYSYKIYYISGCSDGIKLIYDSIKKDNA